MNATPTESDGRNDDLAIVDGVVIPASGEGVRFRERCDSDVFVFIDYRQGSPVGFRFVDGKAQRMSADHVHAATDMFKWIEMTRDEFLSAVRRTRIMQDRAETPEIPAMEWGCAGRQTLHWLSSKQLKTDSEWSMHLENGFAWWPDRQRQTIEQTNELKGPDGSLGYVIEVRTAVSVDLVLGDEVLRVVDLLAMQSSTMASPIYDAESKTLSLVSSVRVHEDIADWMNPLISVAAAMQAFGAKALGAALASHAGAAIADSPHPINGFSDSHDEIMDLEADLFIPHGNQPSRWLASEFSDAVRNHMHRPPSVMASEGGPGLTVEFPFGESTSLLRMHGDQLHPFYGSGLLVIQAFPIHASTDAAGIRLALEFNSWEITSGPFGYFFGSYAFQRGMLHFVSFYPNVMYRSGLIPNLYYAAAERARAVSLRKTGRDWRDEDFSARRGGVLDSILGRLGLGD